VSDVLRVVWKDRRKGGGVKVSSPIADKFNCFLGFLSMAKYSLYLFIFSEYYRMLHKETYCTILFLGKEKKKTIQDI